MSTRKEKIPIVRFRAFSEPWFQNQLSEVAEFSKGRGYSKKDLQPQGTPIILYGRLYTKYESVISNIDTYANMEKNSVISEGGEVIIPASGESSAEISRASCVTDGGVILGGDINIVKPHENLDSSFIAITLSNGSQQRELSKRAQGKSVVHLHNSDLKAVKLFYPSYEEQSAIGSLFRTLDDLLASYKDNLANYQSLKATMLSKMFPKAGQTVPEIRLDGFKGEWRIIKLGDVLSELKSGLSRELSNDDIGLPVIRANNISDGNLNLDRDIKYWFKDDPKGANTANYFVRENDILVNFINSETKMGTAAIVLREPDRETIYTTNILKLTVKEDYYPYFVYLMTFVQSYQNYIKAITKPAVNQASFTTVDFKKYEFLCPAFQEQQAISAYFLNLDNLINSHQEKITQIETLKKKLLQDMFI